MIENPRGDKTRGNLEHWLLQFFSQFQTFFRNFLMNLILIISKVQQLYHAHNKLFQDKSCNNHRNKVFDLLQNYSYSQVIWRRLCNFEIIIFMAILWLAKKKKCFDGHLNKWYALKVVWTMYLLTISHKSWYNHWTFNWVFMID